MNTTHDQGLPFGQSADGRLLAVCDVPRGLACDLVCPQCGCRLVAKKGDVIRHHLAHEADQACVGAFETTIHKAAKQIIADAMGVGVPVAEALFGTKRKVVSNVTSLTFDEVRLEEWLVGMRPDIVGYKNSRALAIEILVTHKCEPEKIDLILRRKTACIEIDLSGIDRDIPYDTLKRLVLATAPRHWIFNAKIKDAQAALRAEAEEEFRLATEATKRRQAEIDARAARELAAAEKARTQAQVEAAAAQAERDRQYEILRQKRAAAQAEAERLAAIAAQQKAEEDARLAEEIVVQLREHAVTMLGSDAGLAWMEKRIVVYGDRLAPASSLKNPENANFYWRELGKEVDAKIKAGMNFNKSVEDLRAAATRFFGSATTAEVWLKGKNPKLNRMSPLEACVVQGGLDRCLAILRAAKK